ncbi:FAD dependent oxidoreductase [Violaceomyces palustris]|uniref:FAD dependent oxidoreductase n=1 Tax=Violaceomyces palustris TaxID=1673888 RepID=A0ACD0NMB4_9BASI|nr:FAD dependent oxidoreductase [Violaceomyces palustris]
MSQHPTSFIVVGSGVFGSSTALELVRSGHKVTVLDRSIDGYAAPDSASNDLNKIIRADYSDSHYCSLGKEAISLWRNDPIISTYYHEVGVMFRSGPSNVGGDEYVNKGVSNANRKESAGEIERPAPGKSLPPSAFKLNSVQDARAAFPASVRPYLGRAVEGFGKGETLGQTGFFNPRGGWAEANNACRAVLAEAQRLGAQVVPKAGVESLLFSEQDKQKVVGVKTTDGRTFKADQVILATGCWSRDLLAKLLPGFERLPQPASPSAQCVMTIQLDEEERRRFKDLPVVLNFSTGFYIFEPNDQGLMKIAIHSSGYQNPAPQATCSSNTEIKYPSFDQGEEGSCRPSETSNKASDRFVPPTKKDEMLQELYEIFPSLAKREKVAFTRICWYSDTRDENWIIDHVPNTKNLLLASGDSGHGYKFLPVMGRLILGRLRLTSKTSPERVYELDRHQEKVFSFKYHESLAEDEERGRKVESSDSGRANNASGFNRSGAVEAVRARL